MGDEVFARVCPRSRSRYVPGRMQGRYSDAGRNEGRYMYDRPIDATCIYEHTRIPLSMALCINVLLPPLPDIQATPKHAYIWNSALCRITEMNNLGDELQQIKAV